MGEVVEPDAGTVDVGEMTNSAEGSSWPSKVIGSRRAQQYLPVIGAGFGAAIGAAAQEGLDRFLRPLGGLTRTAILCLAVAAGVGVTTWARSRYHGWAMRQLARLDLPPAPRPGYVFERSTVLYHGLSASVSTMVARLLSGAGWILLEGPSGIGKSTVVSNTLLDNRLVGRFVDRYPNADRRYLIDLDPLPRSASEVLAAVRRRVGVASDSELARVLDTQDSVIVLDHCEGFLSGLFTRANSESQEVASAVDSTREFEHLLAWLRKATPRLRKVLVVQGHYSDKTIELIGGGDVEVIEPERPLLDEAAKLFFSLAPSLNPEHNNIATAVKHLVAAVGRLPRAVCLLAMTVQAEATNPLGSIPARRVLSRWTSKLAAGDLDGVVAPVSGAPRDTSLVSAARLPLSSPLATKEVRQLVVELGEFPAGIPSELLGEILSDDGDDAVLAIRAAAGQAYRLGLVHLEPSGLAAEPIAAMYLRHEEGLLPDIANKGRWSGYAARALRGDSADDWAGRNVETLARAFGAKWQDHEPLALELLRLGFELINEDSLVHIGSQCTPELVNDALSRAGCRQLDQEVDSLSTALLAEVLAAVSPEWSISVAAATAAGNYYDITKDWDRGYRAVRSHYERAMRRDDREESRHSMWLLGRLGFLHGRYDRDTFPSAMAAAFHWFSEWGNETEGIGSRSVTDDTIFLDQMIALAFHNYYDARRFESREEAVRNLCELALSSAESGGDIELMIGILEHLGWAALVDGIYDRHLYGSAVEAAVRFVERARELCVQNNVDPRYSILRLQAELARRHGIFDRTRFGGDKFETAHVLYAAALDRTDISSQEGYRTLLQLARLGWRHQIVNPDSTMSPDRTAERQLSYALGAAIEDREWPIVAQVHMELGQLALERNCYSTAYESPIQAAVHHLSEALELFVSEVRSDEEERWVLRMLVDLAESSQVAVDKLDGIQGRAGVDPSSRASILLELGNLARYRRMTATRVEAEPTVTAVRYFTECLELRRAMTQDWPGGPADPLLELGLIAKDDAGSESTANAIAWITEAFHLYSSGKASNDNNESIASKALDELRRRGGLVTPEHDSESAQPE